MTHTPETRTVYRWTEEQLERAGWRLIHVTTESDRVGSQREAYRKGSVVVMRDYSDGVRGAYLPEPPPPEELSDEDVEEWVCRLRSRANHLTPGTVGRDDLARAADVIFAALEWDRKTYPPTHSDNAMGRLHRTLRRRPHQ